MSDVSADIAASTGLPEVHITGTPDHLKPTVDKINSALAEVPDDLKQEVVHHVVEKLLSWLMSRFKR